MDRRKFSDSRKILGSLLCGQINRPLRASENARVRNAAETIVRCSFLPHTPHRRFFFASVAGMSRATYGWKHKLPPQEALKPLQVALKKCAWPHVSASPHLAQILRGHSVDFDCKLMCDTMSQWFKKKCRGTQPPAWNRASRQKVVVSQILRNVGWKPVGPWTWKHENSNETFSLLPEKPDFTSIDEFRHVLRESRRQRLFAKWQATSRIDAQQCAEVRYCPQRCKHARKLAFQSAHAFAVLSGASISPMHIASKYLNRPDSCHRVPHDYAYCSFCNHHANDFEHWNWRCAKLSSRCRIEIPRDPMQQRLGWPLKIFSQKCQKVLDHLCARRNDAIEWRLKHHM